MNFIKRIAVAFYVVLVMFISAKIYLMVFGVIKYETVSRMVYAFYHDRSLQMFGFAAASVLLFVNYLFYQFFSVSLKRNKMIAFDNPSGRVTVSLQALEELIKRMLAQTDDIREARPFIRASKRGIDVRIRLSLSAEENVPSVSSKVQADVLKKVQDVIGLDEKVKVTIDVNRIYPDVVKKPKKSDKTEPVKENKPTDVPFQKYQP